MGLLELDNEVFAGFAFYAALCLLKMMAMSLLTVRNRISKDVYANPEDLKLSEKKDLKTNLNDPDVERVRRNHLNDIENIVPFVLLGVLYVLIEPTAWVALLHFRVFACARFLHTVAYQFALPQPTRFLACIIGWVCTASMGMQVLKATVNHLNDIENIIPFVLLGTFYVLIKPNPWVALMHFRAFAGARIFHTIAYQLALPQPSRALGFLVGYGICMSMAGQVLMATF